MPVIRIDPASNKVTAQLVGAGGDAMRVGHGYVWLSNGRQHTVWRFLPEKVMAAAPHAWTEDARPFDRMPRGQDRAPTDLIDKIASLMSEHTGNQVKARNAAASRSLIAFVVIGFLLVVAVHRAVGARQALVKSEERYRTLVETSPDAIVAVDNQGKITMCNQRAASLHGYSAPAAIVGTHLDELFKARKPGSWNGECPLRRLDGSVLPGEMTTAQLYDGQRKPIGSMAIIRDLTERKQAEEAMSRLEEHLIQAQKLESVGRLAGGVANDFNNLLTVINGSAI